MHISLPEHVLDPRMHLTFHYLLEGGDELTLLINIVSKMDGKILSIEHELKVWFDKVSYESPKIWISIQVHPNMN